MFGRRYGPRSRRTCDTSRQRPVEVASNGFAILAGPNFDCGLARFEFYDVSGSTVEVLAIVAKSEAGSWLEQFGNLD